MKLSRVGIDLAKNVYQLHGVDRFGKTVWKHRLLGISKRGDVYLRMLMIHGARAVVARAKHKDDRLSRWVTNIANKKHPNVAAVALANKTARMAWAMLRHETDYDPDFAIR